MMKQKQNKNTQRIICISVVCLLLTLGVFSQSLWQLHQQTPLKKEITGCDTVPLPLPLPGMLIHGADTLTFPDSVTVSGESQAFSNFFELLDSLRSGKDTVLTIVHLGDSHIQAGKYSGQVMRLLQKEFGNAGRGWISPLKLSRTNEPDDYFITSSLREWTAGRCIQHTPKTTLGIGGIGIRSLSSSINLNVMIAPKNGAGYSFNQAILYRKPNSMPMLPTDGSKRIATTSLADTTFANGIVADTFRLSCLADTLLLHSTRRKQGTDQLLPASSFNNTYYGFSLSNGKPGILYHSIGVNGAMYVHYTDSNYVKQLALLHPQLLIISLGTNETFGRRYSNLEFEHQIKHFLSMVKQEMPAVEILITTPPECYKRTYKNKKRIYVRNANTEKAAGILKQVAKEENVICWDLFAATGGSNSCRKWQTQHLMARDRIHFAQRGYEEQGLLLYRALMNSYNMHLKLKEN